MPKPIPTRERLTDRLRNRLRKASGPVPFESLALDLFQSRHASPDVLRVVLKPILDDIPGAELRSDGLVVWTPPEPEDISLRDARFIVLDVETTGSSTRCSRVTEVAAYAVERGEIIGEFETLVNPLMPIPDVIVEMTGITNEMAADAPKFGQIAEPLAEFIGDGVIVAHNARFDTTFLQMEFANWDSDFELTNDSLCTVKLSRKLLPGLDNYKLHTVAESFGIEIFNRHRAGGDAFATAKLFLNLLDLLVSKGVETVAAAGRL